MDTTTIIIIIVAIIAIFLIIKFAKAIIKIVGTIVVVGGIAAYIYFGTDLINKNTEIDRIIEDISIENIKVTYCTGEMSHSDSIKCECIIMPLYDDLTSRFSNEKLNDLPKNKLKFASELLKSFNNKKLIIKKKLKEKNAVHLLKDFKNELKSGEFIKKIKEKNKNFIENQDNGISELKIDAKKNNNKT